MPANFAENLLSFRPSQQKGAACWPRPLSALCERAFLQVLLVALDHLLDHLAADGAGLAGGQIAVVALLEVDADLPWCTPNILKSPFAHVFALRKGGKVALHNVM